MHIYIYVLHTIHLLVYTSQLEFNLLNFELAPRLMTQVLLRQDMLDFRAATQHPIMQQLLDSWGELGVPLKAFQVPFGLI